MKQEAETILENVLDEKREYRVNMDSEKLVREFGEEEKIHDQPILLEINPSIELYRKGQHTQSHFTFLLICFLVFMLVTFFSVSLQTGQSTR